MIDVDSTHRHREQASSYKGPRSIRTRNKNKSETTERSSSNQSIFKE